MNTRGLVRCAWLGVCATVLGVSPAGAQLPDAVQHAAKCTVLIEAKWEIRGRFQGEEAREFFDSNGSGFLIAPQGLLLTNSHVVDPQFVEEEVKRQLAELARWVDFSVKRTGLTVRGFSGTEDEIKRPGHVVRTNRKDDLAIVSVNFGRDMPYLVFGTPGAPGSLQVGQPIVVCGFPANSVMRTLVADRGRKGTSVSVSQGRITALRRDRTEKIRLLQLDAAVVGGNSGGPVINRAGEVLGVLSSTVGAGVNFGIALDTVLDFAENYAPKADRPARPEADRNSGGAAPVAAPDAREVILHLTNGGRERGILKAETATQVTLKLRGLGTMTFKKAEIARIEPVGQD